MYLWGTRQRFVPQLVFYPEQITSVIPKLFRTFQKSYSYNTILHVFGNFTAVQCNFLFTLMIVLFLKKKKLNGCTKLHSLSCFLGRYCSLINEFGNDCTLFENYYDISMTVLFLLFSFCFHNFLTVHCKL